MFKEVSSNCRTCQARKKFPKELKHFTSITNPGSPGQIFVADVIRRSKQFLLITRDAFSDYITTSIIMSEKAEDLKDGLISTTSSVRKKTNITIRVDNAPGFKSLVNSKDKDLDNLDITLELSDNKNKNGVAIVDKAIQELEKELVRISPEEQPITPAELAKATLAVNSRIRNRNLSAYEIMFCREQNTGSNINLDDEAMANRKLEMKKIV